MSQHQFTGTITIGEETLEFSVYLTVSGKGYLVYQPEEKYDLLFANFPSNATRSNSTIDGKDMGMKPGKVKAVSISSGNKNVVAWLASLGFTPSNQPNPDRVRVPTQNTVHTSVHTPVSTMNKPKITMNLNGSIDDIIEKLERLRALDDELTLEVNIIGR